MDKKTQRLSRKWLYLPWAIAAVLLAGYFAMWRMGAAEMKSQIQIWIDDQRAAGIAISHGKVQAEGFPFFLRVHIDDPDIAQSGAWRWRTDRLTLDALPYDLNRLIFSVRSEQKVAIKNYGEWRIKAEDFRASIAADKERFWIFAMTLGGAKAQHDADRTAATVESLVLDFAPTANDPASFMLNLAAGGVKLQTRENDTSLDTFHIMAMATHADLISNAEAWRQAGGALSIKGLLMEQGNARLSVAGDVRLDGDHYPEGNLHAELRSPAAFVQSMSHAGVISAEAAEVLAANLTLAAIAGGGTISAPIELRDGEAQIANVRIGAFPAIAASPRE